MDPEATNPAALPREARAGGTHRPRPGQDDHLHHLGPEGSLGTTPGSTQLWAFARGMNSTGCGAARPCEHTDSWGKAGRALKLAPGHRVPGRVSLGAGLHLHTQQWLRLTTSRPRTVPRREPYLRNRRPPALVARLPPMWQLPFAPRSRGMMKPRSSTYRFSSSKMHPAWQTRIPAKQAELPRCSQHRVTQAEPVMRNLPTHKEQPPHVPTQNPEKELVPHPSPGSYLCEYCEKEEKLIRQR